MKAKDTAISIRKSVALPEDTSLLSMLDFADKVAEVSFNAGYEQRKSEEATVSLAEMCLEHRGAGIREVVEHIIEIKKECGSLEELGVRVWGYIQVKQFGLTHEIGKPSRRRGG